MTDDLKKIFDNINGLDERSMSFLIKALQKNNIEGFDYIEFKQSLKKLKSLSIENETAVKSAFATASTMGLSKEKLISSAKHYKKVLIDEKKEFEKAMQNQINQRISVKKQQSEKLASKVEELKEKVVEINQKISQYKERIDTTTKDIENAESRITETKSKFENTHKQILQEISDDIDNYSKTL